MKNFVNLLRSFSCNDIGVPPSTGSTAMVKLKPQIRFLCIYVKEREAAVLGNNIVQEGSEH